MMFSLFYYLLTVILAVYVDCHKYMWTSQYVRSRTGRLLLERLAEDENYQQETDQTSVSADIYNVWFQTNNIPVILF